MRKILGLLAFVSITSLSAQTLNLFNIDASNYPTMSASFYANRANGDRNLTLTKSDVQVFADAQERRVLSVAHPVPSTPAKLSVVFAVDVSGSMSSYNNMDLAKLGVKAFINEMNFANSDASIISFESSPAIESGFTSDRTRLNKAISKIQPSGGTDYSAAFISQFSGAMTLTAEADHLPVVIFLTDGQGNVNSSDVIRKATASGTKVFTVCLNMDTPDCLAEITNGTNGLSFNNVSNEQEIKEVYRAIFKTVSGLKPSTITWSSEHSCEITSSVKLVQNKPIVTSNEVPFIRNSNQLKVLELSPRALEFDPTTKEQTLTITAKNGDISISDISSPLALLSFNGFEPTNLLAGQSISVKVSLKGEPDAYKWGKITVDNSCSSIDAMAIVQNSNASGLSNIHVDFPNGGEEFISGLETQWKWSGAPIGTPLKTLYSIDNGVNWVPLKHKIVSNTINLSIPPVNSTKVLFKVEPIKSKKKVKTSKEVLTEIQLSSTMKLRPEYQVFLSPMGNQLFGFAQKNPKVIDARTKEVLWSNSYSSEVQMRYSVDGLFFFVKTGSGIVEKYDAQTFVNISGTNHLFPNDNVVNTSGIRLKRNRGNSVVAGKYFVSYDYSGESEVYDLTSGNLIKAFPASGFGRDNMHMTISFDGKYMTFGPGGITIYDLDTGKKMYAFDRKYTVGSISEGGRFAVLGYKNGSGVRMLDVFSLTSGSKLLGDQSDRVFTIVSPKFAVKNAALGQVEVGRGEDKLFVSLLENQSDVVFELINLRIEGTEANSFTVISGNGPRTIDKRKKSGVELNFTPARTGKHQATLIIETSYGIYEAEITGEGIAPKLSFSAEARDIDLGKLTVGAKMDTLIQSVMVNTSKEDVSINKIVLLSADDDQFKLNNSTTVLTKKQGLDLDLSFVAIRRGRTSARVRVYSSQLVKPMTINVFAQVVAPKVYEVNLITKSRTTRRPIQYKLKGNIVAAGEQIGLINTTSGTHTISLQADLAYDYNLTLEGGETRTETVDLTVHKAEKKIELVIWINDEEKTDSPDILYAGQLLDEATGDVIQGEIVLIDQSGPRLDSTLGKEYAFTQSKTKEVKFYAKSRGYLPKMVNVTINKNPKPNNYVLDLVLTPVVVGKAIKLENVLFYQGKPDLLPGSDVQLDLLVTFLLDNSEAKIDLAGHTDNRGSITANYRLSNERVETIKAYLINHGIHKKRLSGKGYGGSVPIASNKTEETRRLNRRVEFKLL